MSTVQVTVSNNQVSVDKPTLSMGGQGRNVQIQWVLNTTGWTFPNNGIVFGTNNQFTHLGPVANGARFQCVDANSDSNSYKYTINVVNGSQTLSLDPIIQNGE